MSPRASLAAAALAALAWSAACPAVAAPPEPIAAVELASRYRLPETIVRAAIGDLQGRPLERAAVRESLERLWALGLFAAVRVEQVAGADGLRLRYHLDRLPHVTRVAWTGAPGLDRADLAAAAGLAVGEAATSDRLARARQDQLDLYGREGYLAAAVRVEAREDPETNGRDVTFAVQAGERARVGTVELRGLRGVPLDEARRAFRIREGQPYRRPRVRDAVRALEERLRRLGFFEAAVALQEPTWDPGTNRVAIRVEVVEGPKTRVTFEGQTALGERVLRERLTFADSRIVDELEVRASARELEQAYRERGHHFAEAVGTLEADEEGRVVRFRITEGPTVTVESVRFQGQAALTDAELARQIQTRPPAFLYAGLFQQQVLDRDLRVILGFLQRQGYQEAAVGPAEVTFSEDRRRARVTIPVTEGPRFTVGAIAVEGQERLPPEELLAAVPVKAGDPWDPARAEEGRRVIERRYARLGHHAARVELVTAKRDHAVDLTYRVAEGAPTRIGRILIRGLVLTRESVVLRELLFRVGSSLNPDELGDAQQRLSATRLFDGVEVEPLRPLPEPFADVELTLRETKPWRLDFGVGFSTEEGARGFVEVAHDNLFGTGRGLSARERLSQRNHRFDLAYREPWLLGTRWNSETKVFWETREEIGFDLERVGVAAGVERELALAGVAGLRASLHYRLEQVDRFNVDPQLAAENITVGRQRVASVTPALSLDRRDQPLDPRRGGFHLLSLEVASAAFASEVSFVKFRAETHWFLGWLPPGVLALSARLGLAAPFGGTDDLPIEDRFVAGGSTTVRGYRENRLGPLDAKNNPLGGEAQVLLNAEWRFPIWKLLGGAVFLDLGAVTPRVEDLAPGEFGAGTGVGLRLATPIGPIRFDVAHALRRVAGEPRFRLYLTVGHPF